MDDKLDNRASCDNNLNPPDINQTLRSDAENIFNEELKTDDSTIVISSSIKPALEESINTLDDSQWLDNYAKKLMAISSPVTWEYHKSEIENVRNIIDSVLKITKWVSGSTMVIVAIFLLLDMNIGAIISGVVGGIIDSILTVLLGMFNSTLKSKKSYFDAENDASKFNKILFLIQTISDTSSKDAVIADVVRKYFDIDKDK